MTAPIVNPKSRGRYALIPLALTLAFFGFLNLPRVRENPTLFLTFAAVGSGLLAWIAVLYVLAKRGRLSLLLEPVRPVKSHYIQSTVQLCFYAYWGWYWREVYAEAPLIVAQFVFLYVFDALLSWSRGKRWRIGFGPLPIILSTNVFIWFKDDWYFLQFLMVAVGALGKELIRWDRDGMKRHIFNPSAFTLAVFSLFLLTTGATDLTWAEKIARTTGDPPQVYVVIFGLGLVVQYFFSVTLMTLSAAAVFCLLSFVYLESTGVPYFVSSNIPAPIFLGMHLLMTDPATTPRTIVGKALFGSLYGGSSFALFGILSGLGLPTFYDKLLPIPVLNLAVPFLDRALPAAPRVSAKQLNLLFMAWWTALFSVMLFTGFIEGVRGPHPARSVEFWKEAVEEGNPRAGRGLVEVLGWLARDGSASAWNELGGLYQEGRVVNKSPVTAATCFAQASRLGHLTGSANLVAQFLSMPNAEAGKSVAFAFDHLERECAAGAEAYLYNLLGRAYETGRGRSKSLERAKKFYEEGCERGSQAACSSLARIAR